MRSTALASRRPLPADPAAAEQEVLFELARILRTLRDRRRARQQTETEAHRHRGDTRQR